MKRSYSSLSIYVVIGILQLSGVAFAADTPPAGPPASKPPTVEDLQKQVFALQEEVVYYRTQAIQAQDQLVQLRAQLDAEQQASSKSPAQKK